MEFKEFVRLINESDEFEGVGITDHDEIAIYSKPVDKVIMIPADAIREGIWNDIEDVLRGKASPGTLGFKTGAPGYYGEAKRWPSTDYTGGS